ncbi:WD40 repeat domain-containing protein [Jiulongibacter sp. NS-SX5]|uniref:WD40 repeat domain-containing protein n=1 Tax=Jiulongibacter sp. NS-SX5 TaxID=3463854 RepID=UPI004059864B
MKFSIEKTESFTGHKDCVYNISGHQDPNVFISSAGDGLLVEWNAGIPDIGKPLAQMSNSIYALHYDAEKNQLWVGENFEGVRVIDLHEKKQEASIAMNKTYIFDIATYQNQAFIASGDGIITVIDTEHMVFKKHLKSSSKSVRCLAINPVERELAAGYSDHTIRIFDLQTLELKRQIHAHRNSVFALAYSQDFETLYSGSRDAHLKSWSVTNEYSLKKQVVAHMFTINDIKLSPKGNLLATCSMDKSIKLWDAKSLKLLKVIDKARHAGHGTSVNRVHWLNEEQLVSASDDRSLSLWKISQYQA